MMTLTAFEIQRATEPSENYPQMCLKFLKGGHDFQSRLANWSFYSSHFHLLKMFEREGATRKKYS